MRILPILILLLLFYDINCDDSAINATQLLRNLKEEFNRRVLDHSSIISDEELLCECNRQDCDKEITDIVGPNFNGICRAHKDGVCYRAVMFDDYGHLRSVGLHCIPAADLIPPGRPLACENVKESNEIVECCSNVSFCNHFEPSTARIRKKGYYLHWYILILLIVGIVFSAAGLLIGIFWCSNDTAKRVINQFLTHITGKAPEKSLNVFGEERTKLKGLLDDLDSTIQSSGSGAGGLLPLAERTISHQITIYDLIGQGRFGQVFFGEWRGDKVAVKVFGTREEASWARETDIYRTNMLRHSNILRWISSDNKDTGLGLQLWLITEYCSFGSLYEYLAEYEINQVMAVQFIRSCILGLSYLHTEVSGIDHCNSNTKPAIAHRDIKSRNILVRSDLTCVIADLGMAIRCINGEVDLPPNSRGGTVRYSAPELLSNTYVGSNFDAYMRMDIYAFSLVIWEICRRVAVDEADVACFNSCAHELPYFEYVDREPTINEMYDCVCVKKYRPTIQNEWQSTPIMRELVRIMCECWSADPNARLPSLNIRFALEKLIRNHDLKVFPD